MSQFSKERRKMQPPPPGPSRSLLPRLASMLLPSMALLVALLAAALGFSSSGADAFGGGAVGGIGAGIGGAIGGIGVGGGSVGRVGGGGPAGVRIGGVGASPVIVPSQTPKPRSLLAVSACSASNGASYDGCTALPSGGTFFWNSTAVGGSSAAGAKAGGSSSNLVHGALEVPSGLGYSSFGFPSRPGAMIGAKVLLLRKCADCPTGAALESYSLDGKKGSLVVLDPSALEVVSSTSRALPNDGGLVSDFVARLPAVAGAADPSAAQWISASGPLKANGVSPAIHTSFGDGVVNLLSTPAKSSSSASTAGAADALTPEQLAANKLHRRRLHAAHAWLMFLAWGVACPLAVGVAAACKGMSLTVLGKFIPGGDASVLPGGGAAGGGGGRTLWFDLHVGLQTLTLALTAAGLGCGVAIKKPTDHGRKLAHEVIGYVVFGAAAAQALVGLFRPPKVSKAGEAGYRKRAGWLAGHRAMGVTTAVLAFANLILGLVLADRGAGWIAGASIVWGALVAGFAAKRVSDERKRARKGATLTEANSSTMAWKASMTDGGGFPSRSSLTTASGSTSNGGGAAAAAMEMGRR